MLDFLQTNSSEIITLLITILASIIPIPFTIKELIKNYNKANEVKLSKKKLQEDLSKIDISKEKLEELSKIYPYFFFHIIHLKKTFWKKYMYDLYLR